MEWTSSSPERKSVLRRCTGIYRHVRMHTPVNKRSTTRKTQNNFLITSLRTHTHVHTTTRAHTHARTYCCTLCCSWKESELADQPLHTHTYAHAPNTHTKHQSVYVTTKPPLPHTKTHQLSGHTEQTTWTKTVSAQRTRKRANPVCAQCTSFAQTYVCQQISTHARAHTRVIDHTCMYTHGEREREKERGCGARQ